jgi:hypothetical protein
VLEGGCWCLTPPASRLPPPASRLPPPVSRLPSPVWCGLDYQSMGTCLRQQQAHTTMHNAQCTIHHTPTTQPYPFYCASWLKDAEESVASLVCHSFVDGRTHV